MVGRAGCALGSGTSRPRACERGGGPSARRPARSRRGRRVPGGPATLVALDNCEHLLEEAAAVAEALLRGCPEVTVLATSRAPLGVPGESDWRVPSLSLPEESSQRLEGSDAARLFVERAAKVPPEFRVSGENAPALVEVCHKLDGIPLAISLPPGGCALSWSNRRGSGRPLALLTGGARSALPRHQTPTASVDWSIRSDSSSSSWLQSTEALRVWWRGSATGAAGDSPKRSPRPAAICSTDSSRTRPAASSIASGMPSSLWHTSTRAGAFSPLTRNSGRTLAARSMNRRAASEPSSRWLDSSGERERRHTPVALAGDAERGPARR